MPAFDASPLSFVGASELMLCRPHKDDSVHSDEFRKRWVHTLARTVPARATPRTFSQFSPELGAQRWLQTFRLLGRSPLVDGSCPRGDDFRSRLLGTCPVLYILSRPPL